jgi:hypothetical protein
MEVDPPIKTEEKNGDTNTPIVPEEQERPNNIRKELYPFHPFTLPSMPDLHLTRLRCEPEYRIFYEKMENRVAYQLAFLLFCDLYQNISKKLQGLDGDEIVVVSNEKIDFYNQHYIQNPIPLLFKKGNIKHTRISISELSTFVMTKVKILIISDAIDLNTLDENLSKNVRQAIYQYVDRYGGILLSFNNGIILTSQSFPGYLKYRNGETTAEKSIVVNVSDSDEKNAFHRLVDLSLQKKLLRRAGTRRFSVLNDMVNVLVKEVAPSSDAPLAVKFKLGGGVVYHFVEILSNESTELRSKDKAKSYYNEVEAMCNSEQTRQAWKSAYSCGQYDSFYLAMALMPFFEVFFGIISNYL